MASTRKLHELLSVEFNISGYEISRIKINAYLQDLIAGSELPKVTEQGLALEINPSSTSSKLSNTSAAEYSLSKVASRTFKRKHASTHQLQTQAKNWSFKKLMNKKTIKAPRPRRKYNNKDHIPPINQSYNNNRIMKKAQDLTDKSKSKTVEKEDKKVTIEKMAKNLSPFLYKPTTVSEPSIYCFEHGFVWNPVYTVETFEKREIEGMS